MNSSCLISGELSGSRLTRFELGGSARAASHSVHLVFACREGSRCTPRSSFSPSREGRRCTSRSCISACRGGRGCTPRTCFSPCRWGRGCSPHSCVSACRVGRVCTPCSRVLACRWGRGCTSRSGISFRGGTASVRPSRKCVCQVKPRPRALRLRSVRHDLCSRRERRASRSFSLVPRKPKKFR